MAALEDCTAALPPEMLLRVLDGFTFDDLRPLLCVSRRWRLTALNSAGYWSFVEQKSLNEGSVELFCLRMSRTHDWPVSVNVDLQANGGDAQALQATILRALREHMHHVTWLSIDLQPQDVPALWTTLTAQAPELNYLAIRVNIAADSGEALPVIPDGLFEGSALRLRCLSLMDVELPQTPLPLFSTVTEVQIIHNTMRAAANVFFHFPSLCEVDMPDYASFDHPMLIQEPSYRQIQKCTWRSGRDIHLSTIPLAATRHVDSVTVHNPRPQEVLELFSQIPTPLFCLFTPNRRHPDEQFELFATENNIMEGRWRSIIDETSLFSAQPTLQTALHTALAGNVHSLHVDAPCWLALTQCLPSLPGLSCLCIDISTKADVAVLVPAHFACPGLSMLKLASKVCMSIPTATIHTFAAGSFDATTLCQCKLSFVNIHPTGDLTCLRSVFGVAWLSHDPTCDNLSPPHRLHSAVVAAP